MQKGYFAAAWGDITQSPGWVSKFLRLGLLLLVPVFGVMVNYGYLYAWARDIAWNVHRPLPERIFGNEDGRLYSRGFFVLVVAFVFSLVPGLVGGLFSLSAGVSALYWPGDYVAKILITGLGSGIIVSLLALVLSFAATFFIWVGSMRVAIYGTLSSGFQVRKIWAMMRYDFMGLLRIFGMAIICDLVIAFVGGVIGFALVLFACVIGFSAVTLLDEGGAFFFILLFCLVVGLLFLVVALAAGVLVEALVARALGYWTRQFEVAQWGGQDDLMPFERRFTAPFASQPQQSAKQAQSAPQAQQQAYWSQSQPSSQVGYPYQQPQPEQTGAQQQYGASPAADYHAQQPEEATTEPGGQCAQDSQGQISQTLSEAPTGQQPPVIDESPADLSSNGAPLPSEEVPSSGAEATHEPANQPSQETLQVSTDELDSAAPEQAPNSSSESPHDSAEQN